MKRVWDSAEPRVAAIIILFHPDLDQVSTLVSSLSPQVELIYLMDNTPSSAAEFSRIESTLAHSNTVYRALGDNLGLATAQNRGIQEALDGGCEFVFLLDQDSTIPPGTVPRLVEADRNLRSLGTPLAAVGPVFVDRKTDLPGRAHHHRWFHMTKPFVDMKGLFPVETDWLISSGCLIQADALRRIGLMRDDLFIDSVDTEWGLRARNAGFLSFVIPTVQINHNIGDSYVRVLGTSVIMHSGLRNYYIVRNWLYLGRVPTMGLRWRSGMPIRLLKFLIVHTVFMTNHAEMVRMMLRGLVDGVRGRMGRYAS